MSVTPRVRSCARIGMYHSKVRGSGAGAPPRPRTASSAAGESRTASTAPACSAWSASRPSHTSIRAISSTRQARSPRVSWRWMMGLIMLSSLTADLEASLVPVIYLSVTQYLMLETAFLRCGRAAAESCNPTQQPCWRLLTLVNGALSDKQIELGPMYCQGCRFKIHLPCKPQTYDMV